MRIFEKYAIAYAVACSHITGIPSKCHRGKHSKNYAEYFPQNNHQTTSTKPMERPSLTLLLKTSVQDLPGVVQKAKKI